MTNNQLQRLPDSFGELDNFERLGIYRGFSSGHPAAGIWWVRKLTSFQPRSL